MNMPLTFHVLKVQSHKKKHVSSRYIHTDTRFVDEDFFFELSNDIHTYPMSTAWFEIDLTFEKWISNVSSFWWNIRSIVPYCSDLELMPYSFRTCVYSVWYVLRMPNGFRMRVHCLECTLSLYIWVVNPRIWWIWWGNIRWRESYCCDLKPKQYSFRTRAHSGWYVSRTSNGIHRLVPCLECTLSLYL